MFLLEMESVGVMKKKFLIITSVLVLFVALTGFWGYNKYFKPDQETQEQLNNQFGAEFFNSFNDEQESNNSAVNNAKSVGDLVKKTDIVADPDPAAETTPNPAGETVVVKPVTQEEINNQYKSEFSHLQSVALGRLDTLYSAAAQEYVQSSKAGTLNRSELIQKYIQAATILEANLDSKFYSTLDAMQAELIANNLPTDLVGVYKSEYENAKSARRSQLLAKVRK